MQEKSRKLYMYLFSCMSWYLASFDSKVRDEFLEFGVNCVKWLLCPLIFMICWQTVILHSLFHQVMVN